MKKLFLFLVLFLSAFTLVACGEDEKAVKLTNKEKFELLQSMEAPEFTVTQMIVQLDASGSDEGQTFDIVAKLNSYANMKDADKLVSYTTFDVDAKTPVGDIKGKGSMYLNNAKAYLDVDASVKNGGTTTGIQSKEVMELEALDLGGDMDIVDSVIGDIPWDEFQELDYAEIAEEMDEFLDFITVYEDGKTKRFEISLTRKKLMSLDSIKNDPDAMEVMLSIDEDSKIVLSMTFNDKKLSKITFSAKFAIDYDGVDLTVNGKIELIMNGNAPTLPTSSQLSKYSEVEEFSIIGKIGIPFGGVLAN